MALWLALEAMMYRGVSRCSQPYNAHSEMRIVESIGETYVSQHLYAVVNIMNAAAFQQVSGSDGILR
jgi:hypothetical protein